MGWEGGEKRNKSKNKNHHHQQQQTPKHATSLRIKCHQCHSSQCSVRIMPASPFSSMFCTCHAIIIILLSVLYLICYHHHSSKCSLCVMPSSPFSAMFFICHDIITIFRNVLYLSCHHHHSLQNSLSVMISSSLSSRFLSTTIKCILQNQNNKTTTTTTITRTLLVNYVNPFSSRIYKISPHTCAWLHGVRRTCTETAALSCGTSHAITK